MTATTTEQGGDVFGVVRIAGTDVALPLEALREVVPCPVDLAGLPADAVGLLGAMDLRATVLPVLDLRLVLGRPAPRRPDQVVVVIAWDGQAVGLLADEVRGTARVPHHALAPMRTQTGDLLFSAAFRHPQTDCTTSVLDTAAVLRLPGLPTVADLTRVLAGPAEVAGAAGPGGTVTLVRCGPHVLALGVEDLLTTVPSPVARPSVLTGELCLGVVEVGGREVAMVDPLVLLGLGRLPEGPVGAGVVVDVGTGQVVLAVGELLDLVESGPVLPVPAFTVPHPELLVGMTETATGPCLVLDGPALREDRQLQALAAMNTAVDPEGDDRSDRADRAGGAGGTAGVLAAGPAHLVFSVGVDAAAALAEVTEIVPYPAELTRTSVGGSVHGVVLHRGSVVPVLCLSSLLGRAPRPVTPASCLLLVAVDGGQVAFAVDALRSIDPLTWSDPDQVRGRGDGDRLDRQLQSAPLVQVGADSRLLPRLDLTWIARVVGSPTSPALQERGAQLVGS